LTIKKLFEFIRVWTPRALLLAGVGLVVYLVQHYGWQELWASITSADPWWLLLMAVAIQAGLWARVWKWRMVLGPGAFSARLFFFAKVAATWTPGRLGEFAPLMLGEHRNMRVAAWILTDRLIEVWMTIGAGVIGAVLIPGLGQPWVYVLAGLVVAAPIVGLAGVYLFNPPPPAAHAGRIVKLLHVLHDELRVLGRMTPFLVLLTALVKALDIWAIVALFLAFGHHVGFWLVGAVRLAHALVGASPVTPESSGAPYVAAAMLIHDQTAIPYPAIMAALAVEVVVLYSLLHINYVAVGGLSLGRPQAKETTE